MRYKNEISRKREGVPDASKIQFGSDGPKGRVGGEPGASQPEVESGGQDSCGFRSNSNQVSHRLWR